MKYQDERLGISIEPSQVRLKTRLDDPYKWEKMKEREYLFMKNLSNLSTNQLRELCNGIGKSFVAVGKPVAAGSGGENTQGNVCADNFY